MESCGRVLGHENSWIYRARERSSSEIGGTAEATSRHDVPSRIDAHSAVVHVRARGADGPVGDAVVGAAARVLVLFAHTVAAHGKRILEVDGDSLGERSGRLP